MSEWISAVPAVVVAALVVLLPGVLILSAAGARGLRRWALAGPVSIGLIAASAIVLELMGVRLGVASVALITAVLTVAVFAVQRLLRGRWPQLSFGEVMATVRMDRTGRIVSALGVIVGIGMLAANLMRGIGSPENVAQLFDNVFHLNAIALIASTGEGSSLTIGNLTEASRGFYPAAFHDAAALVVSSGVADTPTALNAMTLVLGAIVWPLSVTYLATRIFGSRPVVFVAAGVLAPALAAFPYRMLSFGVLYSFLCALSMLPALVAVLLELFGTTRTRALPVLSAVLLAVTVGGAVALCHPSVIVAALLLAAPFAISRGVRAIVRRRHGGVRTTTVLVVLVVIYLAATAALFVALRPQLTAAPWNPSQSIPGALRSAALLAPTIMGVSWPLVFVFAAGVVAVALTVRRSWPTLMSFALAAGLYVAAAALPSGTVRDLLVGVWYRDTERLSAIMMIAAVPLLIGGAVLIAETVTALVARISSRRTAFIAGIAVLVLLIPVLRISAPRQAIQWVADAFTPGQLLSEDERAVLAQLAQHVPSDGVVVGNPMTGASLTPAFAGRDALAPHIFGTRTSAEQYLLQHWDEAGTNPEVCPLVRDLNAYWALDFGTSDVLGRGNDSLAGTDTLAAGPPAGITRVEHAGTAGLYEATACL